MKQKQCLLSFFMRTRPSVIHQVPARTSLDAIYYRDECFKALITKKKSKVNNKWH